MVSRSRILHRRLRRSALALCPSRSLVAVGTRHSSPDHRPVHRPTIRPPLQVQFQIFNLQFQIFNLQFFKVETSKLTSIALVAFIFPL
ncbi:hypothetical protein L6452_14804 [Arctium lappa]|uniref:Uncharacterized protein n=1 Tax=Arctium lappa TaxID=4217 RepID=A0ACB9CLZ7_ARCLA|nr:hypothetical protein L6452_14804 [Arctium lappa]